MKFEISIKSHQLKKLAQKSKDFPSPNLGAKNAA